MSKIQPKKPPRKFSFSIRLGTYTTTISAHANSQAQALIQVIRGISVEAMNREGFGIQSL